MKNSTGKNDTKECVDLRITVPCELANRVRGYADKNDTSVANVLIEALDAFIRSSKTSGR